ncbi:hypothetical protein [Urbifossiella limnaea]|nr:hypothetical protein [Urbifossiella limnaea]
MPCPRCQCVLDLDDEEKTHRAWCPNCGARFIANEPGLSPAQVEELRRRESDRRVPREQRPRSDAVRFEVEAPATALKVHGWFTLGCGILLGTVGVLFAVLFADDPEFHKAEKATRGEVLLVAGMQLAQGLCGVVTGTVMVVGAHNLTRFERIGWVKAAAVVGMLPVVTGCCLLGIPVGVWTLRLLNRPEVHERFDRRAAPPESVL